MTTLNRVNIQTGMLEGLTFDKIINPHDSFRSRNQIQTVEEDLTSNFEFDRTFNNVDVIEDMNIETIESPHDNKNSKLTLKTFVPIKKYDRKIALLKNYGRKIKR